MTVACFTREERDGIFVIFPLEGPKRQNCLLVNESVRFVYDRIRENASLEAIRSAMVERAYAAYQAELAAFDGTDEDARPREPDPRKVHFDLYRILLQLRDHGIGSIPHAELRTLLVPGNEMRGATQIMAVRSISKVAEFLTEAATRGERNRIYYSLPGLPKLPSHHFSDEAVTRRHLAQSEVFFVHLDERGEVEACSVIAGFAFQPASLVCSLLAARRESREAGREAIGRHFARVCGLLSVVTLSAMIRCQVLTGGVDEVTIDEDLLPLLAELEFRISFDLPNEFGEGRGITAYDKLLL